MKNIMIALALSGAAITDTAFADTAIDIQNSKASLVHISSTPGTKTEHMTFDGQRLSSKQTGSMASREPKGSSVDRTATCSKRDVMSSGACKAHCGT